MPDDTVFDASDLSCQGLQAVIPDDTRFGEPLPTFHGSRVINYEQEMYRRSEGHVQTCDLIGHIPFGHIPPVIPVDAAGRVLHDDGQPCDCGADID